MLLSRQKQILFDLHSSNSPQDITVRDYYFPELGPPEPLISIGTYRERSIANGAVTVRQDLLTGDITTEYSIDFGSISVSGTAGDEETVVGISRSVDFNENRTPQAERSQSRLTGKPVNTSSK